jgi:hypothetical protein
LDELDEMAACTAAAICERLAIIVGPLPWNERGRVQKNNVDMWVD